ncbi:MAG: GNAT family N-acetyltransferase [Clostridium sp.]|nr:GNAT family N-acetyltransferase [Clostridium sp.]
MDTKDYNALTIILRAFEPEDVSEVYDMDNRREDWWTGDMTAPYSRRQLTEYASSYGADPFSEGQLRLIAQINEGKIVGIADLYEISARHSHAFIGLYVKPEYRGCGIGSLILQELLRYNQEHLGIESLGARIAEGNKTSRKLFKKCGFQYCGTLPRWHRSGTTRQDIALWTINV